MLHCQFPVFFPFNLAKTGSHGPMVVRAAMAATGGRACDSRQAAAAAEHATAAGQRAAEHFGAPTQRARAVAAAAERRARGEHVQACCLEVVRHKIKHAFLAALGRYARRGCSDLHQLNAQHG